MPPIKPLASITQWHILGSCFISTLWLNLAHCAKTRNASTPTSLFSFLDYVMQTGKTTAMHDLGAGGGGGAPFLKRENVLLLPGTALGYSPINTNPGVKPNRTQWDLLLSNQPQDRACSVLLDLPLCMMLSVRLHTIAAASVLSITLTTY